MTPEERAQVEGVLALFRASGVRCDVMTDAAGQVFLRPNPDDLRAVFGDEAAALWERMASAGPRPQGSTPPTA